MSKTFNAGLEEGKELPHPQPWRHMLHFADSMYLFNNPKSLRGAFRSLHDKRERAFIHMELDDGDLAEGSTAWYLLAHLREKLARMEVLS